MPLPAVIPKKAAGETVAKREHPSAIARHSILRVLARVRVRVRVQVQVQVQVVMPALAMTMDPAMTLVVMTLVVLAPVEVVVAETSPMVSVT